LILARLMVIGLGYAPERDWEGERKRRAESGRVREERWLVAS